MKKLNIGSGKEIIKGWLNIGLFSENDLFSDIKTPYGKIVIINEIEVLHMDVRDKIPVKNGSVSCIYTSHFIEHLNFQEGIQFLKRCYQYLKKRHYKINIP